MGDFVTGDYHPPAPGESTQQRIQAETQYLPAYLQAMSGQVLPTEQALQNASNVISPQQQALNAQLYAQYAPQYAQAQSQADLSAIQGAGGQAALAGQQLQQQIDPEYYAQRSLIANKLGDLVNNPISGSEQAAIERANAQNALGGGRFGLNTSTQTLANAVNFGQAGRDRLGQALQLATGALPSMKSGTDTFAQATGRGGTNANNITQNQLGATNLGQSTFGTGNALGEQISQGQQNQQNILSNRRTVQDFVNQGIGSCCWIFMEAYNGRLPWWIRQARDLSYHKEPLVAEGYKLMAKFLVPLMVKFKLVRELVNELMIVPLTCYSGDVFNVVGYQGSVRRYQGFKNFWWYSWKTLGKISNIIKKYESKRN